MPEAYRSFYPMAFTIRSAMGNGIRHPLQDDRRHRVTGKFDETRNATHQGFELRTWSIT